MHGSRSTQKLNLINMHLAFLCILVDQFIIHVLFLAYTTQACIWNLNTCAMSKSYENAHLNATTCL
jgi:hypothetical protein